VIFSEAPVESSFFKVSVQLLKVLNQVLLDFSLKVSFLGRSSNHVNDSNDGSDPNRENHHHVPCNDLTLILVHYAIVHKKHVEKEADE